MRLLYNLGYRVFFWMKQLRKRFAFLEKPARLYEEYFALFLNRKFVPWMQAHPAKNGINNKKRKEQYIVSLTSFPARIEYVHIAIETLLRQRCKPDQIILWLAESQFPDKKLPEKLTVLCDRGLTIRWCDNLRSHKKYFYAMREFPDANIILADDDLFYSPDTIARLVRTHKKRPRDIIAASVQIIGPEMTSGPSLWQGPKPGRRYVSSVNAQAFTGAGSLFPARWWPEEAFHKERAMALAATADDLWLKAMSLLAGVKTTACHKVRGFPVSIDIKNNQTLFQMNGTKGENVNDRVWAALVEHYQLGEKESS